MTQLNSSAASASAASAQHLHRKLVALSRFLAWATIAAKACWSVAFVHLLLKKHVTGNTVLYDQQRSPAKNKLRAV